MKNQVRATITAAILTAVMAVSAGAMAAEKTAAADIVNINTATASELAFLPGVGPSKAQAIVNYRKNRPFKKVEHIMRVKGIGRKGLKKMRPYLTINGPTTAKKGIVIKK